MNIRIEKIDNKNSEAIDFLVEENLKLFLELNPKFKELYNDKNHSYKETIRSNYIPAYKKNIKDNGKIYVAYKENDIIGIGYIEKDNYLSFLFIKEEFRNMGIGTMILERLISECSKFGDIKTDAKTDSISLFERLSFYQVEGESNEAYIPMELRRKR